MGVLGQCFGSVERLARDENGRQNALVDQSLRLGSESKIAGTAKSTVLVKGKMKKLVAHKTVLVKEKEVLKTGGSRWIFVLFDRVKAFLIPVSSPRLSKDGCSTAGKDWFLKIAKLFNNIQAEQSFLQSSTNSL